MMSDAVLTPTEEAMVKLASNPKANNDGGSTVDDDPLLDLFPLHTFAAEIEKQNAEAVARARNSGASLAPNVSNMLQRGIVLADTSSYWQMSQAADVLVLPDSPIDNAPKETEPFAQAMSRTGHTLLGVIEGGWNRTVADITRMALSPLTSEMPASETIDLDTGIVNRVPRSPEALAFARQMRGYADFQMIEPRNDAQRLGQRGFDVASTILGAYGLLGKAYNLTGTAFGEIGGANTGSTASKVSFESSLNAADRALGLNAGDAISANPVSAASYQRLLNQGTDVRFVRDTLMGDAALFNGSKNSVTVNLLRHSSADDVASTIVHEATHQNRWFNGNSLGTQYEEYLSLRNEFLYGAGRRPTIPERQIIWQKTQEMYPTLPQGRAPSGGSR